MLGRGRGALIWLATAGVLLAPQAGAQAAPDSAARRAAMQHLAFLEGHWVGDAWAMVGRGQRSEVRQSESARFVVGGQVLVLEGIGRRVVAGTLKDTVFYAFGTIDWLPERGYVLRSFTLAGQQGEFPLTVTDRGFAWELKVPGGMVRYAMRLTDAGDWDERGEFVREGAPAVPVFGMVVKRVPSPQ